MTTLIPHFHRKVKQNNLHDKGIAFLTCLDRGVGYNDCVSKVLLLELKHSSMDLLISQNHQLDQQIFGNRSIIFRYTNNFPKDFVSHNVSLLFGAALKLLLLFQSITVCNIDRRKVLQYVSVEHFRQLALLLKLC